MKSRWRWEIRAVLSALLFAAAIAFFLGSWQMGWLITLSLVFHELGHGLTVSRFGIDWELGFSALGAWTKTPLKARNALNHYANSLIHLAGPFFSLLLSLFFIILHFLFPGEGRDLWLRFGNFNALICLLNLLPMGKLSDGGKFIRKLFSSADESLEQRLLALVGALPLAFVSAIFAYRLDWASLLSLLSIVLWFVLTTLLESKLDAPSQSSSEKIMRSVQARDLLSGMILMLLISMAIAIWTPFWLTPRQLVEMMAFFSTLFR